jgi:hypothetical protein
MLAMLGHLVAESCTTSLSQSQDAPLSDCLSHLSFVCELRVVTAKHLTGFIEKDIDTEFYYIRQIKTP